MTIKRISADAVVDQLIALIQEADLDLLAELYTRYCINEAVVVYDGSESNIYESGDVIATDESRSNGPRM